MSLYLISHVVFQNNVPIYGPVQVLEKFLTSSKQKVEKAFLPLFLEGEYSQTGVDKHTIKKPFSNFFSKYLFDIWYSFRFVWKNKPGSRDVVIAVDPLNCIGAVILAPFYHFTLIYYTADYSDKRFENWVLNEVYFLLDQICLHFCDQNWCVSERIVKKRHDQGKKEHVYFIPNTPVIPDVKPSVQDEKKKLTLLYVGRMDKNMHVNLFPELMKALQKKQKNIQLILIGGGEYEQELQASIKKQGLTKVISYLGPQPNPVVLKNIQASGIGLALYNTGNMWNEYGDSMKIREYQYFGLPVITTEVPSNSHEVEEFRCGILIQSTDVTVSQMQKAVEKIQNEYKMYSSNTLELTKKRKKEEFLRRALALFL